MAAGRSMVRRTPFVLLVLAAAPVLHDRSSELDTPAALPGRCYTPEPYGLCCCEPNVTRWGAPNLTNYAHVFSSSFVLGQVLLS